MKKSVQTNAVLILVCASMFGQLKLFARKINHIDVIILLEKGGENGGIEAANARVKPGGAPGVATHAFFRALEQEASIVIASAPLVRNLFFTQYIGQKQLDEMSGIPSIKEFLDKQQELGNKLKKQPGNEELEKQLAKLKQNLEKEIFSDKAWAEWNKNTLNARKLLKNLVDEKKWSIYQADNKYVIFIPKSKYPQRGLGDFGLSAKLKKVAGANIEKIFENSTNIPIDVGVLNNVFTNDFSIKKRIYLMGHGRYSKDLLKDVKTGKVSLNPGATSLVGQLKYDQYVKLIERLDKIGCEFFAVTSCFAGGWNLLTFHSKLQKGLAKDVFSRISVSYPIAILALSDVANLFLGVNNYKTFFERLDEFFTRRGRTISHWIHKPFSTILEPLTGSKLNNAPSIKFPGTRTFFRPVDVDDKVQVLSYPSLIKHELIHKVQKGPKDLRLKNKEALLIYPSIIDVPLTFLGAKAPSLISMIPGPAHHYLQSITAANIDVIEDLFEDVEVARESVIRGIQPKALFIGKLKHRYSVLKNVLISSRVDLLTKKYSLEIIAQHEDKKHYVKNSIFAWKEISKEQAYKKIRHILDETTPAKEALTEATGGIESERQFTKKIDTLLK